MYILENVPGAMQYIKARYSHIIIDEYQDCGEIQDKVFIKLVESGLTGIAVGDINQAIYGFTKRFPKYLIALMKRDDFARFELSKIIDVIRVYRNTHCVFWCIKNSA